MAGLEFVLRCAAILLCFHAGAWRPRERSAGWLWLELLAGAFVVAEVGFSLRRDYYRYRAGLPGTMAQGLEPPQAALKVSWGAFLIAFGLLLVPAMGMADRGWILLLASAVVLGLGCWNASTFVWALAPTWAPFLAGAYAADARPLLGAWILAGATYFFIVVVSLVGSFRTASTESAISTSSPKSTPP